MSQGQQRSDAARSGANSSARSGANSSGPSGANSSARSGAKSSGQPGAKHSSAAASAAQSGTGSSERAAGDAARPGPVDDPSASRQSSDAARGRAQVAKTLPKVVAIAKVAQRNRSTAKAERKAARRARASRWIELFGQYGVWSIPIFAVFAGLIPRSSAAFSTNPAVYAQYLSTGRYEVGELASTVCGNVFGVLSILALGALLFKGRGRWVGLAGLIIGLVGASAMLYELNTLVIRSERLRHDLLSGNFSHIAFNAQTRGSHAALLAIGGAALLTLAWFLYGIAVFITGGLGRTDGILLIVSAPMLYLGGMVLGMIPILGSFLLLAAGLGIGVCASRVVPAGQPDVAAPHYERGAVRARYTDLVEDDFSLLPAASAQDPVETPAWARGGDVPQVASAQAGDLHAAAPAAPWVARNLKSPEPVRKPQPRRNAAAMNNGAARSGAVNGASSKNNLSGRGQGSDDRDDRSGDRNRGPATGRLTKGTPEESAETDAAPE